MALPELHNFERLVKNKPAPGSNDYPVAIKAKHLDENWKMTTLLESNDNPKTYEVEYTKEGTRIKKIRGLPPGASAKQFDVCENGTPVQYWMLVWEEEPEIPE
jgi:hypothetical protein